MRKIIFIILFLIVVGVLGWYGWQIFLKKGDRSSPPVQGGQAVSELRTTPRKPMSPEQAALVQEPKLSPEVKSIILKEANVLKDITNDPLIIAEIKTANEKDKNLSLDDITKLDEAWLASKTTTSFIQQFLVNKTAQRLIAFQKDHPGFKEIFIVDSYGLNVGQTDKTSDYYQADEFWFANIMVGTTNNYIHGKIEFDDSSQTEAISIYVPVIDPSSGETIGVLKGVLNLASIKGQL